MKVVRLSELRIGCLYLQEIFLVIIAVRGWPQGHNAVGKIMSMKNSNDTIMNRSRDRPAWSSVPQPTRPPFSPRLKYISYVVNISECTKCTNSARLLDRPWTWRQSWSTVTVPLGSDLALMLLAVHHQRTFPHFTLQYVFHKPQTLNTLDTTWIHVWRLKLCQILRQGTAAGEWITLRNEKLHHLWSSKHIIRIIKGRRVRWNRYMTVIWRQEILAKCKLESLNATDHFRGLGVNGWAVLKLDVRVWKWLIGLKESCSWGGRL